MYTIHANVPITRRKSFFLVADPAGKIVFRHRHFWPCVVFLDVLEEKTYKIVPSEVTGPHEVFTVKARRIK